MKRASPDPFVAIPASERAVRLPGICPGCGGGEALSSRTAEFPLNRPAAVAAAFAALAFPLGRIYGPQILQLLHQGPPVAFPNQWAVFAMLMGLGYAAFYSAGQGFSVTYEACSACTARLAAPAHLLLPALAAMTVCLAVLGTVAAVGVAVSNPFPLGAGIGLVLLAISLGITWAGRKAFLAYRRGCVLRVEGDHYSARVHSQSPAFLSALRDQRATRASASLSLETDGIVEVSSSSPAGAYRPLDGLARWCSALLLATIAWSLLCSVFAVTRLASLQGDLNLLSRGAREELLIDRFSSIFTPGLLVLALAVFLAWLHRARRNLSVLGAKGLLFSPGWAVGWWFVPLGNLYQPFKIMTETWKASSPSLDESRAESWQHVSVPRILTAWWLLFILACVAGNLADGLYPNLVVFRDSPYAWKEGLLHITIIQAIGAVAWIASAVLLMVAVTRISQNQEIGMQQVGKAAQICRSPDSDR
ncbi:MAG: DUF4328 domain-containing protein [Acidobacteriota bacterium]